MLMEYYWNSWRKLWDNNILINDVVVGDQWPNHLHGNGPMDSVQVGKAVFVKLSDITLSDLSAVWFGDCCMQVIPLKNVPRLLKSS